MPTQLTDIQTDEVSLVGKGANRKRFLLFKSEEGNMDELIKELIEATEKFEGEDDLVKALHNMSDEDIAKVKGAMRIMSGVMNKIAKAGVEIMLPGQKKPGPVDKLAVTVEFLKAAKQADREKVAKALGVDPEKYFNGDGKKPQDSGLILKADGTLDLEQCPENMRPVFQAIWKDRQETGAKLKSAEEKIEKAEKESVRKEWRTKADEFKDLPGINVEELGNTLMNLDGIDHDGAEGLMKQLRSNKEVIEKGNLFGELGSHSGAPPAGSATEKVRQMAKSIVQKDDKMAETDAIAKVLNENPELYSQYKQENQIRA